MIPSYLIENQYIGVKRARHGLFMFNRNDLFIGRSLDLYGEWCESELVLLGNYLRESDVVLDIGANIGTHAVAFGGMVGKAGRVHAFEPQPGLFHLLCGNVALNCLENVIPHRQAVASAPGQIELPSLPPPDLPFNFGAVSMSAPVSGEAVEVVSVDSLDLTRCTLIKIDVEGIECDVLKGAEETIHKLKPLLFVENDTVARAREVIESIFRLGYKAYWQISPYFQKGNFFGNTENIFAQYQPAANLLCLPETAASNTTGVMECTGPDDDWMKAVERINKAAGGGGPKR